MAKYKYLNTSKNDLEIPNVGIVKAGNVIESSVELNNKYLELQAGKPKKGKK